jgi:hypothetical protein
MRKRLRIVKSNDPAVVFDDLDSLRQETMPAVKTRRARTAETFARFPHRRALALRGRVGADGWCHPGTPAPRSWGSGTETPSERMFNGSKGCYLSSSPLWYRSSQATGGRDHGAHAPHPF